MLEQKHFLILLLRRFVEFCTAKEAVIYSCSAFGCMSASFLGKCTVITTTCHQSLDSTSSGVVMHSFGGDGGDEEDEGDEGAR